MNRFIVLLAFLAATVAAAAQELNARVSINRSQVSNTKSGVFEALEQQINRFLNERRWTELQFREAERIQCSFNITVDAYSETDNSFQCTLLVAAVRPVYGSSYTTTTFSMNDKDFNFNFAEFDQLEWRSEQIDNNLTAVLAFWAYYLIAMDLDSFSPMGGTALFNICQDICSAADGLGATGWKAFGDYKNRFALVNDYMDGAMEPLRQFQYDYYRKGLDRMGDNADEARAAVTEAVKLLAAAREAKSMSQLPVIFTDFKRDELVSIYAGHGTSDERTAVYDILFRINPSQNSYWDKIKQ
ncbi:MAG: DUF4835 family protein [Bacteroidaceae bacterium]|nr:DUF4835 family protein [Bacteroidaceae bacterium]